MKNVTVYWKTIFFLTVPIAKEKKTARSARLKLNANLNLVNWWPTQVHLRIASFAPKSDGNDAKRIWRLARFQIAVIRSFDSPYLFHVKQYDNLSYILYRLYRYVKTRSFLWFLSSFPISFDLCFCFCSWTLAKQRKGWLPLTWSQSGRSRDHQPKGIAIDPECLNNSLCTLRQLGAHLEYFSIFFLFQGWWGFNSSGELPCESHVKNPWDPRIEILWEFGRNQRDGKIPLNLSKSRKIAAVDLVFAGFPKAAQGFFTCRRLWYEKQMKTMNHLVMTLYQLVATDFERIFPNKPFFGSSVAWAIILEHSLLKKTLIVYYI